MFRAEKRSQHTVGLVVWMEELRDFLGAIVLGLMVKGDFGSRSRRRDRASGATIAALKPTSM